MFVEVVNMTNNTQFKTLVNTWLNQKQPMITPSTHASFTLIAENHLIPYFGKRMWKSMLPIRRMERLDPEKSNLKMVRSTRSTV